ncbi:MAG: hypothetical protein QF545_02700 [Candidatus Thalassarchaeaceae archaeon]|nr:hypothetical protein [Candidatus Thalassarchaeaceae archaeon]
MSARDGHQITLPITLAILLLGMSASSTLYSDDRAELADEESALNTHSGLNFPGSTVGSIHSLTAIGAGFNYTCVVMDNNGMKCWGRGADGYLGNGNNYDIHTPVNVNMPTHPPNAVEMSGGDGHHSCLIASNGSFYCWGEDGSGQIGHGHYSCWGACWEPHGPSTLGGQAALTIVTGLHHTCAIAVDLTLYCWGQDIKGQVGNGEGVTDVLAPQEIGLPLGRTAVSINAGMDATCVILDNGSGMCWGSNQYGHLGDGTNDSSDIPTPISVLPENRSLVALDVGFMHTCGILDDGSVYCWGNNSHGQLGDGTNITSAYARAASLPPGRMAISIDAGREHTCAILDDSSAYCWGRNTEGQIGDGTTDNSSTPVSVSMPSGLGVAEITAGNFHTCAVATNGSVYCWGGHGQGALGLGEDVDSDIPAFVDLGAEYGRHALMSERDNDDDGIVNLFDPFPDGCSVGWYESGITCLETSPGWYADGYEQFPCDMGSFQPYSGQGVCITATPGHFVNTTAASSQTQCQPGNYQPLGSQTSCLQADPGNYSSETASTQQYQCQQGNYQPNYGASGCLQAAAGHYVLGGGAHNQTPCPAGTYQLLSGTTYCFEATRGFHVPSAGATAQVACESGTFSADSGQAQCTEAYPGYFASGSQQTSQSPCQPGQFQPGSGQTSCLQTDPGNYTDAEGTADQIPCGPGTYQSEAGQTSCLQADPGSYSPGGGASQIPCSAGTFTSESGQSECTQAEPGNYVSLDGATTQTPCSSGEYQSESGGSGCEQAPPGQVVSADGTSAPAPCPPGKYQPEQGQSMCMQASPGHFVNESGASEQIPCQPGSFQSEPGQSECIPSSPGNYASGQGSTAQTPCAAGTFQEAGEQESCTEAMPGHHVPEEGAVSQSTCTQGSYQPGAGQDECLDASPGNFVNSTGSISQTPCQPGRYQGDSGTNHCKNAGPGHYVPESGAIEQLKCPSGEIQELEGQTACKKPKRPLWLTFLMFAVPAVLGGSLAIMYIANRKKEEQKSRKKSYLYAEDMRSKR